MKRYWQAALSALFFTLIIILAVYLLPKIYALRMEENKEAFISFVKNIGFWGYLVIILLNAFQVVIAIIPGEIFEVLAGLMYGPYFGFLAVELGVALGSIIVLGILKLIRVNKSRLRARLENKKLFKALQDSHRAELIIFFITIIPCLPKDLLLYIIPFTKIKTSRFLLINAVARIPSIISSTYFGSSLLDGNYTLAIIIFSTQAIVGVLGLIFHKKILDTLYKHKDKKNEHNNSERK